MRHEDKQAGGNPIAVREALRSYIREIKIDTDKMSLEIVFQSAKTVSLQMRKTNTKPIRYSYKTDKDADWIDID